MARIAPPIPEFGKMITKMAPLALRFDDLCEAINFMVHGPVRNRSSALVEFNTSAGKRTFFVTDSGATGAEELMRLSGIESDDPDDEIVGCGIVQCTYRRILD